jgi:hypothetical protein
MPESDRYAPFGPGGRAGQGTGGTYDAWSQYGGGEAEEGEFAPTSEQTYSWQELDPSAWQRWGQRGVSSAGGYLEALRQGKDSYAEAMLAKGQGEAARAMQAQAMSRGANPLAERSAIQQGGQLAAQNTVAAAGLRAQEMAAARQQYQAQLGQQQQAAMMQQQLELQQQMAAAQHYAQLAGLETQERGQDFALAGSFLSDRDLKEAATMMSPAAQDELASNYQAVSQWGPPRGAPEPMGGLELAPVRPVEPMAEDALRQRAVAADYAERAALDQSAQQYLESLRAAGAETESQLGTGVDAQMGEPLPAGMQDPTQSDEMPQGGIPIISRLGRFGMQKMGLSDRDLKVAVKAAGPEVESLVADNLASMTPRGRAMLKSGAVSPMQARRPLERWQRLVPSRGAKLGGVHHYTRPERAYTGGLGKQADKLAANLELQEYRYGNKALAMGAPPGERMGIMAQDLEKSPLGQAAVLEIPGVGKAIDVPEAVGVSLGLHGRAFERLDALERQVGAGR